MDAAPSLPPPAIEQPAPYQVSFGLVTGVAAPGTRRVVVTVRHRELADSALRGRRFSLRVALPLGDVAVRITTIGLGGGRSSAVVRNVFGLPAAARPRMVGARNDPILARRLRHELRRYPGTASAYVQSLTGGAGAAWNAKARFPAASTLKLAIAVAVLAEHSGIPPPSSSVGSLLREMIVPSDDAAANALLIWLAGSTSAGGSRVNGLMRSIGLRDSVMYGGYEVRRLSGGIPARVEEQPAFGVGKHTTARDLAALHRAIWLAAGNQGILRSAQAGFSAADGRYLLWLLAHVRDTPKLDRFVGQDRDVAVLHKAGWITAARHDSGLVFWRGGVFVVAVMTWRQDGVGPSSDVLAGRCARLALASFRRQRR
ncbi:MAG: serine hydrolase [Actinobacteria bacterium]|nr:serine hydrolase [Actinomycetota bacterium]